MLLGCFFGLFVCFLVQMDIFFPENERENVCVCVSGRALVYSFLSSLVTAGQGCNLLTQIVNLNEFIICHGKEMPVQRVGNIFFC